MIALKGIRPPIWRRILVSESSTLRDLHAVVQAVFGWSDYHLHEFEIGRLTYGDPESDEFGELQLHDDARTKLRALDLGEGRSFLYRYDFGDDWEHIVRVEKILPKERGMLLPRCLGGGRACPPEDVGGVGGYARCLEAIKDPADEEHASFLQWIGRAFDPEAFDAQRVDDQLRSAAQSAWSAAMRRTLVVEYDPDRPLPEEQEGVCETLPLRRDVVTLLGYCRDNRVTGTQSTGNLPLKAVREVYQRLVNPPLLGRTIEERMEGFRSEEEVRPVYLVHILASEAGLLSGGLGRRWQLTQEGERFLTARAIQQVWKLFAAWWYRVDWFIAYPMEVASSMHSDDLASSVLTVLRQAQMSPSIDFPIFAERVVSTAGWRRPPRTRTRPPPSSAPSWNSWWSSRWNSSAWLRSNGRQRHARLARGRYRQSSPSHRSGGLCSQLSAENLRTRRTEVRDSPAPRRR